MPGARKKKHVNFRDVAKKGSSRFDVISEKEEDPMLAGADKGSEYEHGLVPGESKENRLKQQEKYGIFYDDDYDYIKHLKDVREDDEMMQEEESVGDGVSVSAASMTESRLQLPLLAQGGVETVDMATPPLEPKPDWDPEIMAALDDEFNFDDPDNELENDFMEMANADGDPQPDMGKEDQLAYDFKMMRFQQQPGDHEGHDDGSDVASDEADFDGDEDEWSDDDDKEMDDDIGETKKFESRSLNLGNVEDVLSISKCASLSAEGNRQLQDEKTKVLIKQEYTKDKIGPLDGEDMEGRVTYESDLFQQALVDFNKSQTVFTMKDIVDSNDRVRPVIPEKWTWIEEKDYDNAVEENWEPKPEEKPFIHDGVSILSTLSRTKNQPSDIVVPDEWNLKKKKKMKDPMSVMELAEETEETEADTQGIPPGMSLGEYVSKIRAEKLADAPSTYRPKGEMADEKKERKKAVKERQKERRAEKKQSKIAFKDQEQQYTKVLIGEAAHKNTISYRS